MVGRAAMHVVRRMPRPVGLALLAALLCAACGCYERVVRTDEIPPDGVQVYEPNVPESGDTFDQVIKGDQPKKKTWRDR